MKHHAIKTHDGGIVNHVTRPRWVVGLSNVLAASHTRLWADRRLCGVRSRLAPVAKRNIYPYSETNSGRPDSAVSVPVGWTCSGMVCFTTQPLYPRRYSSGTDFAGNWVGFRVGACGWGGKQQNPYPCLKSNVIRPVTLPCELSLIQ